MLTHDVAAFAEGLSAKLAARTRHVCTLFGAGTSKACGLPDVMQLTARIDAALTGPQLQSFRRLTASLNLEQALSRIRRIHALVEGDDVIDGLSKDDALELDVTICRLILKELTETVAAEDSVDRLASWVARADYERPIELFTVNYDPLIELALERKSVPYFDGFIGAWEAKFRTDMVEAGEKDKDLLVPSHFARLWKLHGSVNWAWRRGRGGDEVVRLGQTVPDTHIAAIFPSDAKYEESRRMPFVVLQDRFRRALNEPETVFLIAGYSWADDHLNELIFEAAARRPRSEFLAFCYSVIPSKLAEVAAQTPNLQVITQKEAILGGIRAEWASPDQDVPLPGDVWSDEACRLGDFANLSKFLARRSTESDANLGLRQTGKAGA